jgi:hypothetical protein
MSLARQLVQYQSMNHWYDNSVFTDPVENPFHPDLFSNTGHILFLVLVFVFCWKLIAGG